MKQLELEFVLFERDDFKISTYAGIYGNTFYDKYDLSEEDVNVKELDATMEEK